MDIDNKQIELIQYQLKHAQTELNLIKSSRVYHFSKKISSLKIQLTNDPAGTSKKIFRKILLQPGKLLRVKNSVTNNAIITYHTLEQANKYREWIILHEPDEDELNTQRIMSLSLKEKPLISIVTPVFNPPIKVLEELIESVLKQTYPHFELCLGNFGGDSEVKELIDKYSALDSRVKHYIFTENKGIGGNSNLILKKVIGEYIALLDHDDTLSPNALFENVSLINQKPYDFIYSDKDKIDEQGNRFDPLFKAALSPEMLLNINYLTHLNVMRTSVVREIGGWDPSTDGAQDWDLFLRVINVVKNVGYIPKVLYHWRVIASSTAFSIETKPYALAGQRTAVDNYLHSQRVKATSYHVRTELFIHWDQSTLDSQPLFLINFSNISHTFRTIRSILKVRPSATVFVLVKHELISPHTINLLEKQPRVRVRGFQEDYTGTVKAICSDNTKSKTVIFLFDTIILPKFESWYENLVGWLAINEVGAVCGRLIDKKDLIVSSGGIISEKGKYLPIFQYFPRYFQSYVGNAEWVRNLNVLSAQFFATDLKSLSNYLTTITPDLMHQEMCDDYCLWLSQDKKKRLVLSPHATAHTEQKDISDSARNLLSLPHGSSITLPFLDQFGNRNLNKEDPMRLFEDELFPHEKKHSLIPSVDQYQHDATILANSFDITQQLIAVSKAQQEGAALRNPKSAAWFLPSFNGVYAGLVNIFSFADYLLGQQNIATTFYVLKSSDDLSGEKAEVVALFPRLKTSKFVAITPEQVEKITPHDIGFATQWATTFPLAKAQNIKKKYYFIQDNEANFYPKGSISALVELSYNFGFYAIAGTQGLLDMYKKDYSGSGTVLKSKVDLSSYYPRSDQYYVPQKMYRVFFYARPNMPRNAFELGIAGLKILKQKLGSDVEIITAGAEWDTDTYGVGGMFTNLGKIAYEAVPKLYRSIDVGLMFMFSGHPGVTASELMASGCPVVVNEYDDITWHELYQHEKTCLITMATASEISLNIERCLTDLPLRRTLIEGGIKKANSFYEGYSEALEDTYLDITRNRN